MTLCAPAFAAVEDTGYGDGRFGSGTSAASVASWTNEYTYVRLYTSKSDTESTNSVNLDNSTNEEQSKEPPASENDTFSVGYFR